MAGQGHVVPMLSPAALLVQRYDPDRFFTALFAPPAAREALFTLYAVNHELARAREAVSNPLAALIRLQWWREVAEGARPRHEVATPLGDALDRGALDAGDILAMIEGREAEADPIETEDAFRAYVCAIAGGVAVAAGRALGAEGTALDALRDLGSAYGIAGILRSVPALARQGRCVLPADALVAAGSSVEEVAATGVLPSLVRDRVAAMGSAWLVEGRRSRLPRTAIAAALPAALTRRDLKRPGEIRARGLGDRVAVVAAAIRGRV